MAKPDIRELLIDCVLDPELLRRMQETPDAVLNEYDVSDRAREILLSPDAGLLELLGEAVGQEQVERRPEKTETPDVNKSESAAEPANSPAVSTLPQSRLALRLVPYAQQAPSSIGGAPEVIVNYAGHLDPLPEGIELDDLPEVPVAVTDGQRLPPVSVVVAVQPAVWTDESGNEKITFSVSAQLPQDAVEQLSGDDSEVSLSPWRHDVESPAVKAAARSVREADASDRYQRLRELIDVMVTPAETAGEAR